VLSQVKYEIKSREMGVRGKGKMLRDIEREVKNN
jgi:hypothetical protein